MEELVSIIMPAFNCQDYISESIESVIRQTYKNWELLIINDCSTDKTNDIVKSYVQKDSRIKYICLQKNCGAAIARNKGIELSKGFFLAFLDSDDLWNEKKLQKQIKFMQDNQYYFTCTTYGKIDKCGKIKRQIVRCKRLYNYDLMLKECPGNSTIIYNARKLGKFYGENIKRRNDFVMWLKVIKVADVAYGMDEILAYHRERKGSISYKKSDLLKYQWLVYRQIEKLPFSRSLQLMIIKIMQKLKYIYS